MDVKGQYAQRLMQTPMMREAISAVGKRYHGIAENARGYCNGIDPARHFAEMVERKSRAHEGSPTEAEAAQVRRWIQEIMPISTELTIEGFRNPFNEWAAKVLVDLLTDSGTGRMTDFQRLLISELEGKIPEIDIYAYAGSTSRLLLDRVIGLIFGDSDFHLTVQGRTSEDILLEALVANGILANGSEILANRPFDTTDGWIKAILGNKAVYCTPITTPQTWDGSNVFLGNMPVEVLEAKYAQSNGTAKAVLLTLTDNGGGGQPVSMANIKQAAEFAHARGMLVWIDACRIFENAFFIKTYEEGYAQKSLVEIVQEMMGYSDVATVSFKKIYSHSGGGILLNPKSDIIGSKLKKLSRAIEDLTTCKVGNGYWSYGGRTGRDEIEMAGGLLVAMNPDSIAERISQVQAIGKMLANYKLMDIPFPAVAGGHAIYMAGDQALPNVPKENCPAEYMAAILDAAMGLRTCALGNRLYAKWEEEDGIWRMKEPQAMDSLRAAIPREVYSDWMLQKMFEAVGIAYAQGVLRGLEGGLLAHDYNTGGFYHFGAVYEPVNNAEFLKAVDQVREIFRSVMQTDTYMK